MSRRTEVALINDLGKYMGMPVLHQRVSRETYSGVLDKVYSRLAGWSRKCLSFAARVTLIQSVLAAIPTFLTSGRRRDTAGEALVDGESDRTVNGQRKDGHGQESRNRAARDGEEEESGLSVPAENAVLPPAEGSPRVSMGEEGLSTTKGGEMGAETATADLEFGGSVDHGGPSSSSFNLDEFLKLANRVIDQGDEASMAALHDLQIRWKSRFGDRRNRCATPMVARGQERPMTEKLLKARRCLLPRIAGQTTVGNGGETSAKIQLPTAAAICDSSSEMGGNGGVSGRPMSAGGRNVSAAPGSPCAIFRRVGERPVTFPATGDVAGADVAAEVGDKVGEVDERAADISPIRADVIHDARAEVIHDARADVIHPRADITNFIGEKTGNLGKKLTPVPLFIGNIPLHTGSNGIVNDKIADAFNNSFRKTLSFIAPNEAKWGGCSSSFT
ncbi:UNVERIFIED_CONTAM: hypothetical protein Sindi_2935000 [Sesamum indicum]